MSRFERFTSRLVPLLVDNIDTDQIIPARFLKTITKEGLDRQLFYDWRYDAEGNPKPDFILNQPRARGAGILLAGDNFGCGSSREHAPWALTQFGFRAVISTSFADIFRQNALKNGLLPIVVPAAIHAALREAVARDADYTVTVDLAAQKLILADGTEVEFPIDPFAKYCLLEGVDELGYILQHEDTIRAFEAEHPSPINTLAPA
jgi:3-isopropylmalate/(R)-2-methylmalate dehydratase small subunit